MEEEKTSDREYGRQPLDAVLDGLGVSNQALVEASGGGLTFKVVGKARKGRWLSPRQRRKVTRALNRCLEGRAEYEPGQLFSYAWQARPGEGGGRAGD